MSKLGLNLIVFFYSVLLKTVNYINYMEYIIQKRGDYFKSSYFSG